MSVQVKNILKSIENMTERYYKPVWEKCDRQEAFRLCNRIRDYIELIEYPYSKFDEGFQYRVIFAEDFREAKKEFANLVFGWW